MLVLVLHETLAPVLQDPGSLSPDLAAHRAGILLVLFLEGLDCAAAFHETLARRFCPGAIFAVSSCRRPAGLHASTALVAQSIVKMGSLIKPCSVQQLYVVPLVVRFWKN